MATPFTLEQAQAFVRQATTVRWILEDPLFDPVLSNPFLYAECIDGRGCQKPDNIDSIPKEELLKHIGYAYPGGGAGIIATTYAVLNTLLPETTPEMMKRLHHLIEFLVRSYDKGVAMHTDDHHYHEGDHGVECLYTGCGFLKMCMEPSSEATNPAGLSAHDIEHLKSIIADNKDNLRVLSGGHTERAIFIVLPATKNYTMCSLRRQAKVPELGTDETYQWFVVNQRLGSLVVTSYLYKLTEIMIAGDFHHKINFADPTFFPYYRVRDIRFYARDTIKHPSRYLNALLTGLFLDKLTIQTNQIVERLAPHLPIYGVDLDEQNQPILTVLKEATV